MLRDGGGVGLARTCAPARSSFSLSCTVVMCAGAHAALSAPRRYSSWTRGTSTTCGYSYKSYYEYEYEYS